MSLTSLIRQEDSALSLWLASNLPKIAQVRRAYRNAQPVRRVRRPVASRGTLVRWNLLGTAIDHRLRFAFAPPLPCVPVAMGVVAAAEEVPHQSEQILTTGHLLLNELESLTSTHGTADRGNPWPLPAPADERLARICYAMAWFERAFRDGRPSQDSPLAQADDSFGLEGLLSAVPDYAVRDLRVQAALAEAELDPLRESTTADQCFLGAGFDGSRDVQGADADLIAGRVLIDIKATGRPERLPRETVYQLAGYALLDYSDTYRINSVGLYMSRIGWLITWELPEFFRLLGARRSVADLRAELAGLRAFQAEDG